MFNWLKVYHLLPYPLRALTASAQGYHLRRWRYGPETEQLVEEALEREMWSSELWKRWQEEKLAYVLHRAATKVPYYRQYWLDRRRHGDRTSWKVLENWPILKKEPLRENPHAFVAEDCDVRRMFCEHTSGTTATPLFIYVKKNVLRHWYALFEARIRRWHGVSLKDRWVILGGQLVVSFNQTRPPFWVWNAGLHQLYMSSYHLAHNYIPFYVRALRRYRVSYMYGYASSMYSLALFVLEENVEVPQLRVAISNAEPFYQFQRESIIKAFKCPARDTYSMAENVCAASECQAGSLHLWPEVGLIEVLDDKTDQPVQHGQTGRFICTGLLNVDMPLIRYEVGDRGALAPEKTLCSCGRTLPALPGIEGRLDDVIITSDGRKIGRLDPVFKTGLHIREAQIIQENVKQMRVRFIPAGDYTDRDGSIIVQRLRDRVGNMEIVLEPVDYIPRSASGKFRAVVSNLPPEH